MSGGNRSVHTDSEDQRVMCADSKHHQATLTDPESPQVTEPVLAGKVVVLSALPFFINMRAKPQFPTITRCRVLAL
jgi:hypothetical protein